jgi:hypothetical protein
LFVFRKIFKPNSTKGIKQRAMFLIKSRPAGTFSTRKGKLEKCRKMIKVQEKCVSQNSGKIEPKKISKQKC